MVASGADAFRDTPWGASLSDASLQGLPPHGIHGPAGFQVFRTCALVSSSSAMAKSGLGREIDQHDVVMRINNAPVRGFEDDVGSKTTLRYTNNYSEGFREQENETVVASVLAEAERLGFKLEKALPDWPRRGFPLFDDCENLVRVNPNKDKTDGFFLALFVRDSK